MKFVFAALLAGCGTIAFDVDQDIAEQHVPGSPLGGILPAFLAPVPLNVDLKAETQKRDTGPAQSANLKSIRFSATQMSGNFDFLDEIHIYVASPNDPSLAKKEIASLKPVPKGRTTIDLDVVGGVDLLPYINQGAEISASASGRQPDKDFSYNGHVTITVHI